MDRFQKAQLWVALANNYRNNLKDDQRALNAYRKAIELLPGAGSWVNLSSITSASEILCKRGKYQEALEVLAKAPLDRLTGYWRAMILLAYAQILSAQGKKEQARARLKEALNSKGIPPHLKKAIEKQLSELPASAP